MKEIIVNGEHYNSLAEACEYHNMNYDTVFARIQKGMTVEDAFNVPVRLNNTPITVNGETYNSIKEACKDLNMNYGTVLARIQRGMTVEGAFNVPVRLNNTPITVNVNGKTYNSLAEACKDLKMNYDTVFARIQKGMTVEDAFNAPIGSKNISVTVNGKTYNSIKKACKDLNMSMYRLGSRIFR